MAEAKKAFNVYLVIAALVGFVVGALLMYLGGFVMQSKKVVKSEVTQAVDETYFDQENAYVSGVVADFSNNSITVENAKQKSKTFSLSPQLFITKPGQTKAATATSSGQAQMLEKGKKATVNVQKKDGQYVVVSVLYTE